MELVSEGTKISEPEITALSDHSEKDTLEVDETEEDTCERLDKINRFFVLKRDYISNSTVPQNSKLNQDLLFKYCFNELELTAIEDFLQKNHDDFISVLNNEIEITQVSILIMDRFLKHGYNVIVDEKILETTPKRKRIRDEVRVNTKESAQKMAE